MGNIHVEVDASVRVNYVVMMWRSRGCFIWDNLLGVPHPGTLSSTDRLDYNTIHIVIDPLTAISMGMVTADQLNYPPGILAAFNLLSKEPS